MITTALATRLRASLLPPTPLPMLEWACRKIIIPDGPFRGQRFDPARQPFSRLLLTEIDSGRWDRIVVTAPTQTGKTLIAYVAPTLYHLLELGESVVAGVPNADMSDDKWRQDFLPVIEASSELRAMLPSTGQGSRAGRVRSSVKFRNGATLRFMSGGGGDKSRAGFTARVLAVTEVDGLDQVKTTSREADPLRQLEARQRAYLSTGIRTYLECTASTSEGRIWREYSAGTESRIARPCPHCGEFVTPEREHLTGWQNAKNEPEARQFATWQCPACAAPWSEQERYAANLRSVLVHRGQEVTRDGVVTGAPPATRSLGFRWSAVDNHFATAADVAADEWVAAHDADSENAERQMLQFVFAKPHDPPRVELTPLKPDAIAERVGTLKKGIVPDQCIGVAVGIDTGKRSLHWTAMAITADGSQFVVDYGEQSAPSDRLGTRDGLRHALQRLREYFDAGWPDAAGKRFTPLQVWIDSGWADHTDAVYAFCVEANPRGQDVAYRPSKGYGEGQARMTRYLAPRALSADVRYVGREFHIAQVRRNGQPIAGVLLVHMNADFWKSQLHQRLSVEKDLPGSVVLFAAPDASAHRQFAEHVTAVLAALAEWPDRRADGAA